LIEDTDGVQRLRVVSLKGKVLQTSKRLSIVPDAIVWSSPDRVAVWNSKDAFEMGTVSGALERSATGVRPGLAAHDMIERNRDGRARKLSAVDLRCSSLEK
jgi:hypothetical protein